MRWRQRGVIQGLLSLAMDKTISNNGHSSANVQSLFEQEVPPLLPRPPTDDHPSQTLRHPSPNPLPSAAVRAASSPSFKSVANRRALLPQTQICSVLNGIAKMAQNTVDARI